MNVFPAACRNRQGILCTMSTCELYGVLLQLVICVVFFIVLLSVLGYKNPAPWNFNISGEP